MADRTRVDFRVAAVRVELQIRATRVVFRDLPKATGPPVPWVAEHLAVQASQYPFQNPAIILNGTVVLTGTQPRRGHAIS